MIERKMALKAQPTVRPIVARMESEVVDAVLLDSVARMERGVVDAVLLEFVVPS